MGITALTLSIGKILKPGQSQKVIGLLTAIYGIGQILGPLVSGILSKNSGNFVSAIVISAAAVILGAMILTAGILKHTITNGHGRSDLSTPRPAPQTKHEKNLVTYWNFYIKKQGGYDAVC